ncbi:ethylene-response factor C3-like [Zingiber officinale]|uniref:Uncharacterized protein n=1 Tax=Zingiber officinale TaxID=94328 RepID=A0A8J5LHY0_ZINOF|nr:ethylene-response factor C3-like [Zingiber officinale]KAG6519830.1 hypothetical protein ZIOFF_023342 [Zingiber officinale]
MEAATLAYDQAAFGGVGWGALNFPAERVPESLKAMGIDLRGSPMLALKKRNHIRQLRQSTMKQSKGRESSATASFVELQDLGVEYLEEIMRLSELS